MKSIEEIKEEYAIEKGHFRWDKLTHYWYLEDIHELSNHINEVAERYSQQYIDTNKELVDMLERVEPLLLERHLYATAADVRELLNKQ